MNWKGNSEKTGILNLERIRNENVFILTFHTRQLSQVFPACVTGTRRMTLNIVDRTLPGEKRGQF